MQIESCGADSEFVDPTPSLPGSPHHYRSVIHEWRGSDEVVPCARADLETTNVLRTNTTKFKSNKIHFSTPSVLKRKAQTKTTPLPRPLPTQEQDLHPYRFDPETQLIHIRVKYCLVRIFSLSLSPTPGFVITTIYCILDTVEEDSFCLALSRLAL